MLGGELGTDETAPTSEIGWSAKKDSRCQCEAAGTLDGGVVGGLVRPWFSPLVFSENNNTLENYNYVGNGNRWVSPSPRESTLPPLTLETPQAASWYTNSGVLNRIASWGYDAAGNIMNMGGTPARSFTYDGENRQVSATIVSATASYVYDGSGQRVSKTAAGQTTYFAYDAFGNLAAEYPTSTSPSPCGTPPCYFSVDHLGSTRLITDSASPANVRRYDFLPFGQEIGAGTNGRTTAVGYLASPDTFPMKFTGQSRDSETKDATSLASLDFFNVRYFSGVQGRFQSVDPGNAGANAADPQTWNAYAYVNNNPLSYTDPSGLGFWSDLWDTLWNGTLWIANHVLPFLATGGSNQIFGGGWFGLGGASTGPWNEQVPISVMSTGSLNTGGVFGSGNTGPYITNFSSITSVEGPNPFLSPSFSLAPLFPPLGKSSKLPPNPGGFGDVKALFGYDSKIPLPSCAAIGFTSALGHANPFTPDLASAAEISGTFYGSWTFNRALGHAALTASRAARTNSLVSPFRSSTFRGLFKQGIQGAETGAVVGIDIALGEGLMEEFSAMRQGRCQ